MYSVSLLAKYSDILSIIPGNFDFSTMYASLTILRTFSAKRNDLMESIWRENEPKIVCNDPDSFPSFVVTKIEYFTIP